MSIAVTATAATTVSDAVSERRRSGHSATAPSNPAAPAAEERVQSDEQGVSHRQSFLPSDPAGRSSPSAGVRVGSKR